MNDWFARWFGKEYLELYPTRDEAEARAAVQFIRTTCTGAPPRRILDLACGSGRHARVLREWAWTVGFDLSMTLLEVAIEHDRGAPYVRGDMRALPFAPGVFDVVTNLFTSFGYFHTDDEHRDVIIEVARVIRPGGTFVLDYFNADQVRSTLVPMDEQFVGDKVIRQRRAISKDGRYVEKTIVVQGCDQTFQERVRLFTPNDLTTLLSDGGFTVTQQFGGYDGGSWTTSSPRVILFAERQG